MNDNKPVLLIDFDETMRLVDIGAIQYDIIRDIALERGFSEDEFDSVFQICGNLQQNCLLNGVLVLCDYNKEAFEDYSSEIFKRMEYTESQPDTCLYDLMLKISKYYDIYCATNNHKIHLEHGFKEIFGKSLEEIPFIKPLDIVATEEYGRFWGKQTPHAFDIITQKIGKKISQCTIIDDSYSNIQQAALIGMKGIHITHENTLTKVLGELLAEKEPK